MKKDDKRIVGAVLANHFVAVSYAEQQTARQLKAAQE